MSNMPIAGDTESLASPRLAETAGGWFQPPANDEVVQLLEELIFQRPVTSDRHDRDR